MQLIGVLKIQGKVYCKGFSQKEVVDYDGTFAPVFWHTSICTIIVLEGCFGWHLYQIDVKITFLNDEIEEEVYMH